MSFAGPKFGDWVHAQVLSATSDSPASLFFEYERGQKVGLWVLAIDMGLLVGPLSKSCMSLDQSHLLIGPSWWLHGSRQPILD